MTKYIIAFSFILALLLVTLSPPVKTLAQGKSKASVTASENRDAMLSDLNNQVADSYQYKIRPKSMKGGGGSYIGYKVNPKGPWGKLNPNGVYRVVKATDKSITFEGKSLVIKGAKLTLTADENGMVTGPPVSKGFK